MLKITNIKSIVDVCEGRRVLNKDRKQDLYYYELRHGDCERFQTDTVPLRAENYVGVNFWGTLVTDKPLKLGPVGISISARMGENLFRMARG